MTLTVNQKLTAVLVGLLLFGCLAFGQQQAIQDGITIANQELSGQAPTGPQMIQLGTDFKSWAKTENENGTLAQVQSYLLKNKQAFIEGQIDSGPLYQSLVSEGYQGDLATLELAVNSLTVAQRAHFIKSVQTKGLYKVLLGAAGSCVKIGDSLESQTGPLDAKACAIYESEGEDLMAAGALVALFDVPAGTAMCAAGAAEYFYGKYFCPQQQ